MKSSLLSAVLALAFGAIAWKEVSSCDDIKYTSVPGFFLQDDPNTNPNTFDYVRKTTREILKHGQTHTLHRRTKTLASSTGRIRLMPSSILITRRRNGSGLPIMSTR